MRISYQNIEESLRQTRKSHGICLQLTKFHSSSFILLDTINIMKVSWSMFLITAIETLLRWQLLQETQVSQIKTQKWNFGEGKKLFFYWNFRYFPPIVSGQIKIWLILRHFFSAYHAPPPNWWLQTKFKNFLLESFCSCSFYPVNVCWSYHILNKLSARPGIGRVEAPIAICVHPENVKNTSPNQCCFRTDQPWFPLKLLRTEKISIFQRKQHYFRENPLWKSAV